MHKIESKYSVGDKVIAHGFPGKIKKIEKSNYLIKLDKGGLINCHPIYLTKQESNNAK